MFQYVTLVYALASTGASSSCPLYSPYDVFLHSLLQSRRPLFLPWFSVSRKRDRQRVSISRLTIIFMLRFGFGTVKIKGPQSLILTFLFTKLVETFNYLCWTNWSSFCCTANYPLKLEKKQKRRFCSTLVFEVFIFELLT